MIPAITPKFYQTLVNTLIALPLNSPERIRLHLLQRQLAEAQQVLSASKTLADWQKAG